MALPERLGGMTLGRYTAEMQAEMDRLARLMAEMRVVNFNKPLTDEDRAADEKVHALWNVGPMPEIAESRRFHVTGDASLGSAGCDAILFRPHNAGNGLIYYVHGGGWCLCSLATHERAMRTLAQESGRTVVGVEYRLAPEHPFPAGLKDVVSALRKIRSAPGDFGLPEGPVVIAGDSAGGNLALSAMLHEIDDGRELPTGAVLFYGVYGFEFDTPSYRLYADGHLLTRDMMRRMWEWYLPDPAYAKSPLAVPLLASDEQLRTLPPLLLVAAEMDPLTSDTVQLMERLSALGRSDTLHVEPGTVHSFIEMTAVIEAADRVMRMAGHAADAMIKASECLPPHT